jgi:membrane protein DedA with SNARE-associated domain/membrane-associated phospholipid phosphatase
MHETIAHLIASYGYVVLFLIVGLESFGIPLPGETALVSAAAFAASGRLDIVAVIAAAAAGAIVGDNAGYWLGRTGGVALLHRHGRRVGLDEAKIARAHRFFERHGAKTVFLGRFIALLRSWAAVLAGVGHMPYRTFTMYNALGGVVWATIFGTLGYLFGQNLPRLERYAGQAALATVLLIALAVLVWLLSRWFSRNRTELSERAVRLWERIISDPRLTDFRRRHATALTFIGARFARGEYLGLHLTIGFVVSAGALWLFGGVTEDVIHHDPLTVVDVQLAEWLRAHASPVGDRVAVAISMLGSPATMAAIALVVAAVLALKRRWIVLGGWIATFAGGAALDWMLKRIIQRPRPPGALAYVQGETFSFPSGHAMGSVFGYGMLAYVLVRFWATRWKARTFVPAITALLVLAIGLSRLYLGVHYFSDVIGGYAVGIVWLATCISGVEIALGLGGLHPWQMGDLMESSR